MQPNIGDFDRMIRVVAGVLLLSLLFFLEGELRWLGLIGLVPLITGLVRRCPLYAASGINSLSADSPNK
jgi:hypothetical protein